MNKKLLFALIFLAFISCKKNDVTPDPAQDKINPVGTWYLKSTAHGTVSYNNSDFPCLSNNKLIINSDGTFHSHYSANDTCYILNTPSTKITIGKSGDPDISGTFIQNENTVRFSSQYGSYSGTLSTTNGITEMSEKDTNSTFTSSSIFIKL
jgi:hypothetical protein